MVKLASDWGSLRSVDGGPGRSMDLLMQGRQRIAIQIHTVCEADQTTKASSAGVYSQDIAPTATPHIVRSALWLCAQDNAGRTCVSVDRSVLGV